MKYPTLLIASLAIILFSGCAARTIYSWGKYEDVIYATYSSPGKVPPERQVEILERDYQKARSINKPVPPGFHAYLGSLYYQLGKLEMAGQEFEAEKTEFPESAVFMNRLLANVGKK